jgi:hypothetical protein
VTASEYRARADQCAINAELSRQKEISDLWRTVEASYRFLIAREEAIEREGVAPI